MLKETQVRQAKPRSKPWFLFGGGGLYVQINPSGSKWLRYKFRFQGKQQLLSLGVYPDIGVREAHERHAAARRQLAQGINPSAQRKADKAEALTRRSNSFAVSAEAWYAKKRVRWAPATSEKVRIYLDRDLLPALGERPISEIRRPDLVDVLRRIEKRGALDVAKKCRGWLSGIFHHAWAEGIVESNPATELHVVAAPIGARRKHPHLSFAELPAFLQALDRYPGDASTRDAIKLLLLTAVRPGELRGARWEEIDFERAVWKIPAERMKMRLPHTVPLPEQAVTILQRLHTETGHRDLVFPSRDDPRYPMSENTINLAIGRMGYKGRQTGHGFRYVISTALNERSYPKDWIEMQLAHGDPNETRGTYNEAEYFEWRRGMMAEWGGVIDKLRQHGSVGESDEPNVYRLGAVT